MWEFKLPVEIYFGHGQLERLPMIMDSLGIKKAALFISGSASKNQRVKDLLISLGDTISLTIGGIKPNPDAVDIDAAAGRMRRFPVDGIVAIGGGSVIDTGKAASVLYANEYSAAELLEGREKIVCALPIIAIPTTSGSGSEVTRASALTYKEKKYPLFNDKLFPAAAIIDPGMTLSCPPALTAVSGMDALSHSIECLMHKNENAIANTLALDAVRLIFDSLERCISDPGDQDARSAMAKASLKAGIAISLSGCTISHACSYALTTTYDVPHGEACAFTLDHTIRLCQGRGGRMDFYARRLGFNEAGALAGRIGDLKRSLGMRSTLEQLGADRNAPPELAQAAMNSGVAKNHYFEVSYEDILAIFLSAM